MDYIRHYLGEVRKVVDSIDQKDVQQIIEQLRKVLGDLAAKLRTKQARKARNERKALLAASRPASKRSRLRL